MDNRGLVGDISVESEVVKVRRFMSNCRFGLWGNKEVVMARAKVLLVDDESNLHHLQRLNNKGL